MSAAQGRFTGPDPLLSSGRPDIPQSWYTDPTGLFNWDTSLGSDSTNEELLQAGTRRNKQIVKQRQKILGALNKMAGSGDSALQGVASAYGQENDGNGVSIGQAKKMNPKDAAAQAGTAVP